MKNFLLTKILEKVKSDRFLTNSFIFFVGSFVANLGNYLFHFLMTRMLSVESYGELQSLIAISVVFSIPITALLTVLVKYVARFKAEEQWGKIYTLFLFFTKKMLLAGAFFLLTFFLVNGVVTDFLKLNSGLPVIILGVGFLPSFLGFVNRGIIQGLEKFKSASLASIIEVFSKVFLAVLLVKLGLEINGVVGAIVLAGFVGYFATLFPLRFLLKKEKNGVDLKEMFRYFFPVLFTVLFLNLFYNIDMILVKHFMSARAAGEYGALALIGRIIFFLSGPIVGVMFPMAAAASANNTDSSKVFQKTCLLVAFLGIGTLLFYFLFPSFVIKMFVGDKFLGIGHFLGWFGIYMFFYSLVNLFSQYFLSIQKTDCAFILGAGVLLEVALISLWHNSLWQVVWIMNGVTLAVLLSLAAYYFRDNVNRQAVKVTRPVS